MASPYENASVASPARVSSPTAQGPVTFVAGALEEFTKDLENVAERLRYIADNLGLQDEAGKELATPNQPAPSATTIGERLNFSVRAGGHMMRQVKRQLTRLENM